MTVSLDEFLRNMRSSTVETEAATSPVRAALAPATVAYMHAAADLIDAFRTHHPSGYTGAAVFMATLVNGLPPVASPAQAQSVVSAFEAALAATPSAEEPTR